MSTNIKTMNDLKSYVVAFLVKTINSDSTSHNANKAKIAAAKVLLDFSVKNNNTTELIPISMAGNIILTEKGVERLSDGREVTKVCRLIASERKITFDEAQKLIDQSEKE